MSTSLKEQLLRKKPIRLATSQPHGGPDLSRSFGTFQLMMFGVGATVGTGIFFVLQEAVPDAGPAVIGAFLVAGLAAGLSAICYAELAGAIPVSGSTYSYAYHSLGELVAMVIAACVLLEYGVAAGAVAVGWSGYFNELLDKLFGFQLPDALSYSPIPVEGATSGLVNLPAIVLVFLCTLLLIRGASESARVNTIMVIIKLGVLMLFVVIGLTAFQADRFDNFWAAGSAGITAAAGTIFFSFIGLDAVSTAGEEVRNPQKALPLAIMGALVVVVTVYLLVALAGVGAQPLKAFESEEQQNAGLSVILENITGSSVPGTILAAGAVISIFSVTLVTLYGQTRILFAMGRDRMLPDKFAEVDNRTMTPRFNTIVVGIVVSLDRRFRPRRLSVGHGLDRHPGGLLGGGDRRHRAAPHHAGPRAAVPGPAVPGPADPDRGRLPLRALGTGGPDLGDLRDLAGDRAGVLLLRGSPSVPAQRRGGPGE